MGAKVDEENYQRSLVNGLKQKYLSGGKVFQLLSPTEGQSEATSSKRPVGLSASSSKVEAPEEKQSRLSGGNQDKTKVISQTLPSTSTSDRPLVDSESEDESSGTSSSGSESSSGSSESSSSSSSSSENGRKSSESAETDSEECEDEVEAKCLCGELKSNYPSGNNLIEQCGICKYYWCMMRGCSKQNSRQRKVKDHLRDRHRESRDTGNFNIQTDRICECDGKHNIIYGNSTTIGWCRVCRRMICLVSETCTKTYLNLLKFVAHQHMKHSANMRNALVGKRPTICSECGNARPFPIKTDKFFAKCPHCQKVWCLVDHCNIEFANAKAFGVHRRLKHPDKMFQRLPGKFR